MATTHYGSLILSDGDRILELIEDPTPVDGFYMLEFNPPVPQMENVYAETSAGEGRRRINSRPQNAEGSGVLLVIGTTAGSFWNHMDDLQELVVSAHERKGTLTYTPPQLDQEITLDLEAFALTEIPHNDVNHLRAKIPFTFECLPYGKLASVELWTNIALGGPITSLPLDGLKEIPGQVDAFGELLLTETGSEPRDHIEIGIDDDPVDFDSVVLEMEPELYWRLGDPYGIVDQSGNGYDGTGAGGITIGGQSGALVGDFATSTEFDGTDDRITSAYGTNQLRDAYAGKGTAALTTADTGQTWEVTGAAPLSIIANKLTNSGTGAGYASIELTGPVKRIGGRFTFSPYTQSGGEVVFIAWKYSLSQSFDTGLHFEVSPTGWTLQTIESGVFTILDQGTFGAPLTADSTTVHRAEAVISEGSAYLTLPDGSLEKITDTRIEGIGGAWAGYEVILTNAATQTRGAFTQVWADTSVGPFTNGPTRTYVGWGYRDDQTSADSFFGATGAGANLQLPAADDYMLYTVDNFSTTGAIAGLNWGTAEWNSWAFVHDSYAGAIKGYLGGTLAGTAAYATQFAVDAEPLIVGAYAGTFNAWNGKMQDFAIFSRALDSTEIRSLHQGGRLYYVLSDEMDAIAGTLQSQPGSVSTNVLEATLVPSASVRIGSLGPRFHTGRKKIRARVYPSATQISVRLVWRVGDGPPRSENWVTVPGEDDFYDLDLATIDIPEVAAGTHSWTGYIEAVGAANGDTLGVDFVTIIPATVYARARAQTIADNSTSLVAYDSLQGNTGGTLSAGTATLGGVWDEAGDTADFIGAATYTVRTAVSDASLTDGQYAYLSTLDEDAVVVQSDIQMPANDDVLPIRSGVFARFADADNWLMGAREHGGGLSAFKLIKSVGGTAATLAQVAYSGQATGGYGSLRLEADADGNVRLYSFTPGNDPGGAVLSSTDSDLASGGTLDSGAVGIYDANTSAGTVDRRFRNFIVLGGGSVYVDHALHSGQSFQLTAGAAIREDVTGSTWGKVPFDGQYLRIPAATRADRKSRIAVKVRRYDVDAGRPDLGYADATNATLTVTPRVLLTGGTA